MNPEKIARVAQTIRDCNGGPPAFGLGEDEDEAAEASIAMLTAAYHDMSCAFRILAMRPFMRHHVPQSLGPRTIEVEDGHYVTNARLPHNAYLEELAYFREAGFRSGAFSTQAILSLRRHIVLTLARLQERVIGRENGLLTLLSDHCEAMHDVGRAIKIFDEHGEVGRVHEIIEPAWKKMQAFMCRERPPHDGRSLLFYEEALFLEQVLFYVEHTDLFPPERDAITQLARAILDIPFYKLVTQEVASQFQQYKFGWPFQLPQATTDTLLNACKPAPAAQTPCIDPALLTAA